MSTTELLDRARAAGLILEPRSEKLRVRGADPLPADLLGELRAHKAEILSRLIAGTPGDQRPLDVDHELAQLLGPEGSRREFLGAVELVAHFAGAKAEALEDLRQWWGRAVGQLSAVEWIVSALALIRLGSSRAVESHFQENNKEVGLCGTTRA